MHTVAVILCHDRNSREEQKSLVAALAAALERRPGLDVSVLPDPELHLHLEVRNLLDDRTVEDGFMNPLPGRAVFLTLRAGSPERQP